MLYDVPHRTGTQFSAPALIELARHPRVTAVKDAKGDLFEAVAVMAETDLAYYCGIDELNLPYLAAGASGVVSVVANVAPAQIAELIQAVGRGDLLRARAINQIPRKLLVDLSPSCGPSQGPIMAKAGCPGRARSWSTRPVRLPLLVRIIPPGGPGQAQARARPRPGRHLTTPTAGTVAIHPWYGLRCDHGQPAVQMGFLARRAEPGDVTGLARSPSSQAENNSAAWAPARSQAPSG